MFSTLSVDAVLSGLTGGVLASMITVLYSHHVEKKKESQALTANSLSLISALEAYTISCAEYIEAADDETENFFRTNDSSGLSKLTSPTFTVPPNVDFRHIDAKIASQALVLPFLVKRSSAIAYAAFYYGSMLESIEESIKQCGIRGLAAWELASSLSLTAGLPAPEFDDDWAFLEDLQKAAAPTPIKSAPLPPPAAVISTP
ncbi:hypothetical protein [Photobacterium phosphoreum]|uniref:hypothetical protein n=1 Tax=Photobacterium phosphoreum TaxID=659 RepID=UPI001E51388F|nr:hypothetical protein [Photobacterium phosphoreum]MCD9473083.1 hypothetical protein [Photobacterium phosphoreum]